MGINLGKATNGLVSIFLFFMHILRFVALYLGTPIFPVHDLMLPKSLNFRSESRRNVDNPYFAIQYDGPH